MSAAGESLMIPEQSTNNNPRLEFRDGQFLFASKNLEGGLMERFISDAAVREAFAGVPVDSGWMRPEVVRWGDGRNGQWAIAFFAPAVWELEITRESTPAEGLNDQAASPELTSTLERLKVPLPGIVWFGIGTQYYVWAVKTEHLRPELEIFRCPLPNVYVDGKVCWGLVRPPLCTARTLFDAWQLFITSTFNNHLASGKSKKFTDDVRVLLRELAAGVDPRAPLATFPVQELVRQVDQRGVTLDTAIRVFFETGEMPS